MSQIEFSQMTIYQCVTSLHKSNHTTINKEGILTNTYVAKVQLRG